MDLTQTIEPKSDQLNYDDVASQEVTVTITQVSKGTAEQPVNVELAEYPGRPYKPSKGMRRVMVAAWGKDASAYAGRLLTLYGDPSIRFGGQAVGGIRIRAMSGLDKPLTVPLTVSKGKREKVTVQPLQEPAQRAQDDPVAMRLREVWDDQEGLGKALQFLTEANDDRAASVQARIEELQTNN